MRNKLEESKRDLMEMLDSKFRDINNEILFIMDSVEYSEAEENAVTEVQKLSVEGHSTYDLKRDVELISDVKSFDKLIHEKSDMIHELFDHKIEKMKNELYEQQSFRREDEHLAMYDIANDYSLVERKNNEDEHYMNKKIREVKNKKDLYPLPKGRYSEDTIQGVLNAPEHFKEKELEISVNEIKYKYEDFLNFESHLIKFEDEHTKKMIVEMERLNATGEPYTDAHERAYSSVSDKQDELHTKELDFSLSVENSEESGLSKRELKNILSKVEDDLEDKGISFESYKSRDIKVDSKTKDYGYEM